MLRAVPDLRDVPRESRRAILAKIFDQKQPKSALARRLNEALADTNEWTIAPPRRRTLAPPLPEPFPRQGLSAPPPAG
jgi:hypothetical protein